MKSVAIVVFALLIPFAAFAAGDDSRKAAEAAQSWLQQVDAGDYAQSWSSASALFRSQIPQAQWESAVRSARAPLGRLVARTVSTAEAAATLPGAPDGRYEVVTFDTKFTNKAAAVETVALIKDAGRWEVAGYHVR